MAVDDRWPDTSQRFRFLAGAGGRRVVSVLVLVLVGALITGLGWLATRPFPSLGTV